jgi:hypothetical protein
MRFNEFNEGIDPSAKAAIKGMRELSGDQYYGLYKTMKDVAGHDGKKQTAPEGKTDHEVSDKPFAYAYTEEEKNMIKGVDPKAKQITSDKSEEVKEGYYDLNDPDLSMNPIDLSANPSFKEIVQRYTQLVYQGHASETSPEEDREYDAIEQYVAQRFGEKGSAHLQKAGEVSYWGRDDGHGSGHIRSSNLGRPNQPGGNFRTTKAGKMHGQDVKMMKNKVADRLGRHPEPALPEAYEPVSRPHGTYRSGIFSPNRGIARRSLTAVDKVLQKPLVTQQNTNRINFLLDLVPDRKLKELYGVLAYEHFPFDDLRDLPWFMKRLNLLIARAEQRLNQEQGVAEGQGDLATALGKLSGSWSGWHKEEDMSSPDIDVYEYDDGEGGYYGRGTIEHNLKSGEVKVEYHDSENEADVVGTFKNMGDAMRALRGDGGNHGGQAPNFDRLGQRKQHGPDDLRKTDRTGRKGTLAGGPTNSLKQAIQWNKGKHGPVGKLPEGRYDNRDAYQRDYDNSQTGFGRGERDSERHDIDTNNDHRTAHGTWYVRIDGIVDPTPYQGKAAANAAGLELKKQPGNENKLFMLTTKA